MLYFIVLFIAVAFDSFVIIIFLPFLSLHDKIDKDPYPTSIASPATVRVFLVAALWYTLK